MKNKIILFITVLSCFFVESTLFTSAAEMWLDEKEPVVDFAYSMAVIGDPQIVSRDNPQNMAKIYDYILDNVETKNIQFVMGLGDITDKNTDIEWVNDMVQIKRMDGVVPYSLVRGNHDTIANFNKYISDDYVDSIAGAYEEDSMANTFHTFTVSGIQYLVMCLDFGAKDDILQWANEVIEDHPYHNVIITTHAYMYGDGSLLSSNHTGYSPSSWGGEDNDGDEMWDKLVKKHKNIVLVLSGHINNPYIKWRQDEGDKGNIVTQMLINAQNVDGEYASEGGVGMVAMLYFSEDGKNVQVEYYSTIREQYMLKANQFTFNLNVIEAPNIPITRDGISMDGFAIRLKDYNGLRALFSFDKTYSNKLENELGYTLVEFGAIAMPAEAYKANGYVATLDSETLELTTKGHKAAIWSDGRYVNKILEDKNGIVSYCLAVVDYKTRMNEDLYFCAYSVYTSPSGETVIAYADYEYYEYRLINLYQITLDMYVNGAINSSNSDDAAVWNTLLTGAVTLERDTHYVDSYTYSETEVAVKDMSGNAFGDKFTFSEIAAIGNSKTTASKTVNITLLDNPRTGYWVAVYRGEGAIPGNAWNIYNQLSYLRGKNLINSTDDLLSPNPLLTEAADAMIKTVIIDSGITETSAYPFMNLNFKTLVYADSLTNINHSLFYNCVNITTVYEAKATGQRQKNEKGLADFSGVETINTTSMFRQVRALHKVHLPSSITTIGADFFYDGWSRNRTFDLKVWCGNTAEPENGVADFTGANITSIGKRAFYQLSTMKTLVLPDSCTSIDATAFTPYSSGTSLDRVKQATANSTIAEYCAANSFEYTNLIGTVHSTTEQ